MKRTCLLVLTAMVLALGCASEPKPVVSVQPEVAPAETTPEPASDPEKPPATAPAGTPEAQTPKAGLPKEDVVPKPPKPEPETTPPPKEPEKPVDTAAALQTLASDICQKLIESVTSKDKRRMAVYYFCVKPGGRNAVGEYVASMLPSHLVEAGKGRITLATRRFVSSALKEQGQQLSTMYDETKRVELGKLVGARYIVCGTLYEFKDRFEAATEVVDVETAEIAVSVTAVLPKFDDLVAMAKGRVIDDVKDDAPVEKDAKAGPAAKVIARGDHLYDQGADEEALKAYQTAHSIAPDLPQVLFRLGYLHQAAKRDTKTARGYYERYIEIVGQQDDRDDNYHKAFNNRGVIRMAAGDEKAMEDFDKAIETAPKFADAYSNRAGCRVDLLKHDLDKAVADYTEAIELAPENAVYPYNLALLQDEMERYEGAIEAFTKVIALDPKHKLALYGRGRVYADGLQKPQKAEADLSAAIDIDPDFVDALFARGMIRVYDLNRPKEGYADLRKVLKLDPKGEYIKDIQETLPKNENQ